MSEEKYYIYWCQGMPEVKDTRGWLCNVDNDYVPRARLREGAPFALKCSYHKEVTEAEFRAHHGMLAWPYKCPKGFRAIDFRPPVHGDIIIDENGNPYTVAVNYSISHPILEVIKKELPPITEETVLTTKMETMLDSERWEPITEWKGKTVKDAVDHYCTWATASFRHTGMPQTEFTYTEPINWVIPTDEDAKHRPEVEVIDLPGQLEKGVGRHTRLMGVTDSGSFIAVTGTSWVFCRMDAKQREAWA